MIALLELARVRREQQRGRVRLAQRGHELGGARVVIRAIDVEPPFGQLWQLDHLPSGLNRQEGLTRQAITPSERTRQAITPSRE